MPEYLAPGVYVEETSFRSKPIEGVSTSTTAFVGPCRKGPTGDVSGLLTSFAEFERTYGGTKDLYYRNTDIVNYVAHAVRGYFDNGGARLYFVRIANGSKAVLTAAGVDTKFSLTARFPGVAGNGRAVAKLTSTPVGKAVVDAAPAGSVARQVTVGDGGEVVTLHLKGADGTWAPVIAESVEDKETTLDGNCYLESMAISVTDGDGKTSTYEGLGFHGNHPRDVAKVLAEGTELKPLSINDARENGYWFKRPDADQGLTLYSALFQGGDWEDGEDPYRTFTATTLGTDGTAPSAENYKTALNRLVSLDDISPLVSVAQARRPPAP